MEDYQRQYCFGVWDWEGRGEEDQKQLSKEHSNLNKEQ